MEPMTPKIFVELMGQFFGQGWMLGSSGGMAVLVPEQQTVLISPSSVPKERLAETDLFYFSTESVSSNAVEDPLAVNPREGPSHLRPSACTPFFLLVLRKSPGTQCVIHTHSKCANLMSGALRGKDQWEVQNQEMLKGILNPQNDWRPLLNTDRLVVPIIENAPYEQDLLPALTKALEANPHSPAVLVRKHGLFVWGPSWQKTKVMLECLEYLLEIAWEMHKAGIE